MDMVTRGLGSGQVSRVFGRVVQQRFGRGLTWWWQRAGGVLAWYAGESESRQESVVPCGEQRWSARNCWLWVDGGVVLRLWAGAGSSRKVVECAQGNAGKGTRGPRRFSRRGCERTGVLEGNGRAWVPRAGCRAG